MTKLCALLITGTVWAAVASVVPNRSQPEEKHARGAETAPSTQPTSLALFAGEKPDEWESYQKMHAYMLDRFVHSPGRGLSRVPHMQDAARSKRIYADGTRYLVGRVQLISLNDGKEPFAYVTPLDDVTKNQLPHAVHVPLNDMALSALDELKAGKEVVLTGSADGREFIGAVRATSTCTKCHEVAEGTLLGAFRYPLQREPKVLQQKIDVLKILRLKK